jgi:hypothetical protein
MQVQKAVLKFERNVLRVKKPVIMPIILIPIAVVLKKLLTE